MSKYKLLCFPHAGGSGAVYYPWQESVNNCIKVVGVEYAGRGKRYGKKLCTSMHELVEDLYQRLLNEIDGGDYAVFGHSLGGLVAYEFVCKASGSGYRLPVHIFLSGCNPPADEKPEKMINMCPDHEFLELLINSGGMIDSVLTNKELLDFYLPIIKSDYKVYETHISKKLILPVDMTICAGKDDTIAKLKTIHGWKNYTSGICTIHEFNGGHFYINENIKAVMRLINNVLV